MLEASCGHGGGASYITRTLKPAAYTGLDYNPDGVAYCSEHHKLPGLNFVHGNAEDLPFPDDSFDAVINVEASHAYPQLSRFLAEVARVLRPGGHFLEVVDLSASTSTSSWAESRCSIWREPRRVDHTICTLVASVAVFGVRT